MIAHGCGAQRHVDASPILRIPHGLVARDAFAVAQPLQNHRLFLVELGGQQRLADDLAGRVAKEPLRGLVPRRDAAIERPADDGVFGGIHDGCQQIAHFCHALVCRDIRDGGHIADDAAVRVVRRVQRAAHVLDRARATLHRHLVLDRFPGEHLLPICRDAPPQLGAEQLRDRLADQLRRLRAVSNGIRRVDVSIAVVTVAVRQEHRRVVRHLLEALVVCGQRREGAPG